MATQFYTLEDLQGRINRLIEAQGKDAPVAWWIYTREDVRTFDDNGDEVYCDEETTANVLAELDNYDHIHTAIVDSIENELRE